MVRLFQLQEISKSWRSTIPYLKYNMMYYVEQMKYSFAVVCCSVQRTSPVTVGSAGCLSDWRWEAGERAVTYNWRKTMTSPVLSLKTIACTSALCTLLLSIDPHPSPQPSLFRQGGQTNVCLDQASLDGKPLSSHLHLIYWRTTWPWLYCRWQYTQMSYLACEQKPAKSQAVCWLLIRHLCQ